MNTEAREVSAPESATQPTHQMSETGAARLAALQAQEAAGIAPPADPTIVKDADGGVASLTDGSYQAPEPQPQGEVTIREDVLSAIAPIPVSQAYAEEAEGYRQDAAAIAQDTGIPTSEVNALYAFMGGLAAERLATDASDAVLTTGQTGGPTLWNKDSCRQQILHRYGAMGEAVLKKAAEQFAKLPARVKAYLDQDMGDGSRLGNHPAVVAGLALRAFAALSPEAAARELANVKASKEYWAGDKLAVDKARILAHVAAGNAKANARTDQAVSRDGSVGKVFGTTGQDAPARVGHQSAADLRAEMKALSLKLFDPKSELASDPKRRKAALARRTELMQQLGGA